MKSKQTLLIPIQWYHPGFRAGGLTQAIRRLVEALKGEYQIFILTSNRDHGSTIEYTGIKSNEWLTISKDIKVKYLSPEQCNYLQISKEIKTLNPDIIYLKSMFNPLFTILPLWLIYRKHLISKLIIAPSGMLKESALQYKYGRKKIFLWFIQRSKFKFKIIWHSTDEQERIDIHKQIGTQVNIFLLPEFPPKIMEAVPSKRKEGPLKLLYISRIHPVKNLDFILKALTNVRIPIDFTIGGPIEDYTYYDFCKRIIQKLPKNIRIKELGEVPHTHVKSHFNKHHIFILPSKGEGFGNVILEALANGCPVIISDQTPWRNLQDARAGWDLALNQTMAFTKVIEKIGKMDLETYSDYCQGALAYAKKVTDVNKLIVDYKKLL